MSRRDASSIAPRFIAGLGWQLDFESRQGRQNLSSLTGLETDIQTFPAINRGAIFNCSYGAKDFQHYF